MVSKGKEPEDEQGTAHLGGTGHKGYAKRRKKEDDGNTERRAAAGQDDAK